MRRLLLLGLFALCACATSNADAPRAEFDPHGVGPSSPTNPNNNDPRVYTHIEPAPQSAGAPGAPCGGRCGKGEYCDQRSGVDRCLRDVVPAASSK